jgi:uncharacterized phage protein (TIGR02220 family)
MPEQEKVTITIMNWRNYQPRTDLKSLNWFRVESGISEHPAFFKMDSDGKWLFIFLLSQCAKKNTDCLNTDLTYLEYYSKVSKKKIPQILQILHESVLIRYEFVTSSLQSRVLQYNTNNTNNTNNTYCQIEKNTSFVLQAKRVLAFLNEVTEKEYRQIKTNLDLIVNRLKTGATEDDCMAVIAFKYNKWFKDDKMNQYLRPSTLFSAKNFEAYLADAKQWKKQSEVLSNEL